MNKLFYVAEEARHEIHSYRVPIRPGDWEEREGKHPRLIEVSRFSVEREVGDARSGLEAMAVDTSRNLLYVANEKHPRVFYTIKPDGAIIDVVYPDYSGDISGLDYDETLDRLWVVSDQSERLYLINIAGTIVYDYWDLPMENPEGVAVDNTHQPPLLYVSTDPSAPRGPAYVAALFTFVKPSVGSGLVYYDAKNPPPYPAVPCDGCSTVYRAAQDIQDSYIAKRRHDRSVIAFSVVIPVLFGLVVLALLIATVSHLRGGFHLPESFNDSDSLWSRIKSSFSRRTSGKPRSEAEEALFEF